MDSSPAPDRVRRALGTLGPKMTAFVLVDAVLVLGFVVVLVLFLTDGLGDPATATDDPASPTKQAAPSSNPDASTEKTTFALPSGNIACEISDDAATCTIADSTATPPVDETCSGVVGLKLTVTAEGSSMPCVEGTQPDKAASGTQILEYGQTSTVGDFTCSSSSNGVTCEHVPTGEGFKLRRAESALL